MIRCVVVSTIALILAAGHAAHAKCAMPGSTFAPERGATAGVSWVFVPSYPSARIEVPEGATVEEVSRNDTFAAYRVSLDPSDRGVEYKIRVVSKYTTKSVTYRFTLRGDSPPTDRVLLDSGSYEKSAWTCSHTNAVSARPTVDGWAYRIEWARSEADYRAGKRETVVVPASMRQFWGSDDPAKLELGHISCFGSTIPEEAIERGVYPGITALGPWDPIAMPADPIEIRAGEPPVIRVVTEEEKDEELPEVHEYQCGLALSASLDEAEPERREGGELPLGLLLALAGALAGLPLGIRASRRLDAVRAARLDAWSLPQLGVVAGVVAMAACAPVAAAGGFLAGASASLAGAVITSRGRR